MIDDVPAWLPTRNHLPRLASAHVHQLADTALAAALLGVDEDRLLDAAVITTGTEAYRRRDGIAVIPAALLTH